MPNTDSFMTQMGQGAAGGILGIGLGALGGVAQNLQQEHLQKMQIKGQKEMSDYNYAKQLQMWKDTNYAAQVEQMKKAGINPALLYGMGGGGGQSTGSGTGGNVTGGAAAQTGGMGIQMGMSAAQLGLLKAQKENIEADTANKQATTTKTAGIDTLNAEAQERLTRLNSAWQEIQNSIGRQTIVDAMHTIENNVKIQEQEIQKLKLENKLNERQQNDQVLLMKYSAAGAALNNIQTNAKTENIRQDTLVKIQQVTSMIKQLIMQGENLSSEKGLRKTIGEEITGIYDEVPNPVKDILDNLGIFISPMKGGRHTPVTGFTPKQNK